MKTVPKIDQSFDPALGQPRGVLKQQLSEGHHRHARRAASPRLAPWIDHYWFVYWNLRNLPPHRVETLPHPNVHVVFEAGASKAWGISTAKFSRFLEGESHAFGIKFTPGGFFPFFKRSVSALANNSIDAAEVFGPETRSLENQIFSTTDENEMTDAADAFLLARIPAPDPKVELARSLVARILHEPAIFTVDDLSARANLSPRTLQRLFSQYVGASPKWVIRRYRLHELLERIHSGENLNFATLATDLGYFDQAHLINDFKSITGYAPTQYANQQK